MPFQVYRECRSSSLSNALAKHQDDIDQALFAVSAKLEEFQAATKVQQHYATASANHAGITYRARSAGAAGNAIRVELGDAVEAGSEAVSVEGTIITVQIEGGVTTARQLASALLSSVEASDLITLFLSDSSQAQTEATISLEGGASGSFASASEALGTSIDEILTTASNRGSPLAGRFWSTLSIPDDRNMRDLEGSLSSLGIHLINGYGLIEAGVNLVAPRDLYRSVDRNFSLWAALMARSTGSVFNTVWAQITTQYAAVTNCGDDINLTNTRLVFLGVDVNVENAARLYGAKKVLSTVYWIGSAATSSGVTTRLRSLGYTNLQIASIIAEADLVASNRNLPALLADVSAEATTVRTSVILDQILEGMRRWMSDSEIETLLKRDRPYGIRGLYSETPLTTGPSGQSFLDEMGRILTNPRINTSGGVRNPIVIDLSAETAEPDPITETFTPETDTPPLMPALVVGQFIDMRRTSDLTSEWDLCLSLVGSLADVGLLNTAVGVGVGRGVAALNQIVEYLDAIMAASDIAVQTVSSVANTVASTVGSVVRSIQNRMQAVLDLIGSSGYGAGNLLLCLIGGVGLSFPGLNTTLIENLKTSVEAVAELIRVPLTVLFEVMALASIPMCLTQTLLESILPKGLAECIPVPWTLPDDIAECINRVLDKVRSAIQSGFFLVDSISADVRGMLSVLESILGPRVIGWEAEAGACTGVGTSATMASVRALFG